MRRMRPVIGGGLCIALRESDNLIQLFTMTHFESHLFVFGYVLVLED